MKSSHPFPPIIDKNSKILILGTFPSIDSFKDEFYYGHKRNQFWKIMGDIFGTEFNKRKEKIEFLKNKNIALWDIIKSCERKNSLDSNLKNIEVNDIKLLLKKYPNIEVLFFTGKKAFEVYNKNFKLNIESIYLPSPSPAYAKMKYIEKLTIWKENLSKFLDLH